MLTFTVTRLVKRGHKLEYSYYEGERMRHRLSLEEDSQWEGNSL